MNVHEPSAGECTLFGGAKDVQVQPSSPANPSTLSPTLGPVGCFGVPGPSLKLEEFHHLCRAEQHVEVVAPGVPDSSIARIELEDRRKKTKTPYQEYFSVLVCGISDLYVWISCRL